MKKKYETPIFYLEEFALSQAIATGCGPLNQARGVYPTQGDFTNCGILVDNNGDGPSKQDKFLFLSASEQCDFYITASGDEVSGTPVSNVDLEPGVDDVYDSYCYHNPDGTRLALFAS